MPDTAQSSEFIWLPTGRYLSCRVSDYMQQYSIGDWQELILRSTHDIEWFWQTALEYVGVNWTKPYKKLLDGSEGMPWAKWFIDGEINIASNCLDWHMNSGQKLGARTSVGRDHLALIWEGEDASYRKLTYGELNDLAGRIASLLIKLDVLPGDAVGIYMPMVPEVMAVMFACFKIGAVAVPIFSGFGPQALATRLADAEAKVLFTADAGLRRGKLIHIKHDADEAAQTLPHLTHTVVLKHQNIDVTWHDGRDLWFHEVVPAESIAATKLDLEAEHPCLYLYTSGTTGKPKATVHTHAGALAQISKELGFNFDVRSSDVFFWVTDIGWMMGPWEMIGVTFWGGTIVIFEGAPNYPTPDRLWQIVEKHGVNTLGISPTAIRALKASGTEWVDKHNLSSLRLLGSTGEPWDYESYMWYFNNVGGGRCPVINISGGTEIIGCLLMPLPVMPLKPCSLGVPSLGMDIDVFDEQGKSIENTIGHLVCKKPAPSMTKGFLKDTQRYLDTYFKKFPNVWYHGDWAKVDNDGAWFLFGRSDDTIKVAGKRVGPGEVESVLTKHPIVAEAAVIGIPHEIKGEALVCFVVLMPNVEPSIELEAQLLDLIAEDLGSILRPEKIHCIKALPKTRSGKIVRATIRRQYLGEHPGDLSSIDNPDALKHITSASTQR